MPIKRVYSKMHWLTIRQNRYGDYADIQNNVHIVAIISLNPEKCKTSKISTGMFGLQQKISTLFIY